jgi:hypothetical protein
LALPGTGQDGDWWLPSFRLKENIFDLAVFHLQRNLYYLVSGRKKYREQKLWNQS